MIKRIVIDVSSSDIKIALTENLNLVEIYIESENHSTLIGNIYAGRITNILPGIEAAFVDIGTETNAFMYTGEKKKEDSEHHKRKFKIGDQLAVQVIKDATLKKGAVVTPHLSIPGRFVALMPNQDYIGISKRITDEKERERLLGIAELSKPDGYGIIMRTSSQDMNQDTIVDEIQNLKNTIDSFLKTAEYRKAPVTLYKELTPVEKAVRDLFSVDIDEFIVNDKYSYEEAIKICDKLSPELTERIKLYSDDINIFDNYWISTQIKKAHEKKVWLKSGGYIVIEQTEACVVIDVNTGKNTCKKNISHTIFKTNEEAAIEIAKQIKLRNLSGIIIIDFIDMKSPEDKKKIQIVLEQEVKKDRIKTVVVGMTELGLMQLTRKKTREPLARTKQGDSSFA